MKVLTFPVYGPFSMVAPFTGIIEDYSMDMERLYIMGNEQARVSMLMLSQSKASREVVWGITLEKMGLYIR